MSMSRSFRLHGNRGFTLIELLVVISIISVLIALLMPALSKAREAGKDTQCLNNVRQIGVASNSYATDSKGFLPGKDATANPASPTPSISNWAGNLIGYLAGAKYDNNMSANFTPIPALTCGVSRMRPGAYNAGAQHVPTNYAINISLVGKSDSAGLIDGVAGAQDGSVKYGQNSGVVSESQVTKHYPRLQDITLESNTILFADSITTVTNQNPPWGYSLRYFLDVGAAGINGEYKESVAWNTHGKASGKGVGFWHGSRPAPNPGPNFSALNGFNGSGRSNVAWADGHASSVSIDNFNNAHVIRGMDANGRKRLVTMPRMSGSAFVN
mgnify:CR=1 FL=1